MEIITSTMISVLLPTYNSAATVRETLVSVCWADEILVVDSFSQDKTLEICREYGATILQHEYVNSAKQKNWAIPQCNHEWILQVDTDEVLEPGLMEEILQAIATANDDLHGFKIPFKHHVLGEWVRYSGLYPEYHLRLFRRDVGRFEDKEVHAHILVPGRTGMLKGHILHYGMPSLSKQLGNIDRYSRYQAHELHKHGRHFSLASLLLRPVAVFCYKFFWQQGLRAGWRGFWLAALAATFEFWTLAKLWEIEQAGSEHGPR